MLIDKNDKKQNQLDKKHKELYLFGLVSGVANGVFGAGGGIFAVTGFKRCGQDQQKAQSSSVAVMFLVCFVSACALFVKGEIRLDTIKTAGFLIPFGLLGSYLGTVLMQKFSLKILKNIFAYFMIVAGIKFLF